MTLEELKAQYPEYLKELSIDHEGFKEVTKQWCIDVCLSCWASDKTLTLTCCVNVRRMFVCQEMGIALTAEGDMLEIQILQEDRAQKFIDLLVKRADKMGIKIPKSNTPEDD